MHSTDESTATVILPSGVSHPSNVLPTSGVSAAVGRSSNRRSSIASASRAATAWTRRRVAHPGRRHDALARGRFDSTHCRRRCGKSAGGQCNRSPRAAVASWYLTELLGDRVSIYDRSEGHDDVARWTVQRLMRINDLRGVSAVQTPRPTVPTGRNCLSPSGLTRWSHLRRQREPIRCGGRGEEGVEQRALRGPRAASSRASCGTATRATRVPCTAATLSSAVLFAPMTSSASNEAPAARARPALPRARADRRRPLEAPRGAASPRGPSRPPASGVDQVEVCSVLGGAEQPEGRPRLGEVDGAPGWGGPAVQAQAELGRDALVDGPAGRPVPVERPAQVGQDPCTGGHDECAHRRAGLASGFSSIGRTTRAPGPVGADALVDDDDPGAPSSVGEREGRPGTHGRGADAQQLGVDGHAPYVGGVAETHGESFVLRQQRPHGGRAERSLGQERPGRQDRQLERAWVVCEDVAQVGGRIDQVRAVADAGEDDVAYVRVRQRGAARPG